MTPKPIKGTYDLRFNSDTPPEHQKHETKSQEPTSMTDLSPTRKKNPLISSVKTAPLDDYEIGKKLG
jgi:hypothetical protein